jgi:VWFA-related protein
VAGRLSAEDMTGAASLISDRGDVTYRARIQPRGDVRIESGSGNVYCELSPMLNLRGWLRAGGVVSWEGEPPARATSVEKQLGVLGPLLYAASVSGDVQVKLTGSPAPAISSVGPAPTPPPIAATPVSAAPPSAAQPEMQPRAAEASTADVPQPQGPVSQPTPVLGGYSLKVDVDSVLLNVSVRDGRTNRSVAGLRSEDFTVYEDGVQQQVAQLTPMEAPFDLLLLLDVSGSTASYVDLMKEAAIDFTRQLKSNDRIAIATFNSDVRLVQSFTSSRAAAERAIQRIRSGGGTAFYDALMESLDSYMRDLDGRSAIVVFTDGVDNQLDRAASGSSATFGQLYRRVQESDTMIYTIFLDTEGDVPGMTRSPRIIWPGRRGGIGFPPLPFPIPIPAPRPSAGQRATYEEAREQLLQIAEQTGGRMYSPKRIEDLTRVYSEIADDLRIQYQLGYNSSNRTHDGRWRQIKVRITSRPDAVVRTRKGYYARKA